MGATIRAIGICASIVDVSPFSSLGATVVATTPDPEDRLRMTRLLTRWGRPGPPRPAVMIGLPVIQALLVS